jgi:hypothetical protein
LESTFYRVHLAKNELRVFIRKRLGQARKTRAWRRSRKAYHSATEHQKKVKKNGKTWLLCQKEKEKAAAHMNEVLEYYGVTNAAVLKKANQLSKKYGFFSVIAQTMADDVWRAVDDNIYHGGSKISVRSWRDDDTIRAKQYNRCILLKNDDKTSDVDGVMRKHPYISFNKMAMPLDIRDHFEMDMLEECLAWMDDSEIVEKRDVRRWLQTGEIRNSHRPCYVSLQLERKKNKTIVWAIIIMAGYPSSKKDEIGLPRYSYGKGKVGDDLGVVSNHHCYRNDDGVLEIEGVNTAVFNEKAQLRNEEKIKRNQRAMDRSLRATNPEAFDHDGMYKPGKKCRRRSRRYFELKDENRDLHRRNAIMRDNAVKHHANEVRSHGDHLIIENNSPSAWAKKAAPARNPDGSIDKTSIKKRKRLGSSVEKGCPGTVQSELIKKFGQENVTVVSQKYRASQFNPVTGEYIAHDLSERTWKLIDNDPNSEVLRDAFSSFDLYCSNAEGTEPNRELMLSLLGEYFSAQEAYISRQKESGCFIRNSGVSPP